MTPNQRDVFLYSWSRRRQRGRRGNAMLCAGIGAAGGVLFAVLLAGDLGSQLTPGTQASPSTRSIATWLGSLFTLFVLSVPTFAVISGVLGDRLFRFNEAMYQGLLAQGATPPASKPTLKASERGPQIAVAIAMAIIAGFIIVVWAMYG